MTAKRKLLVASIAGLFTLLGIWLLWSPARRSDDVIRVEILKATPLGSSEKSVEAYARRHFRERRGQTASRAIRLLCHLAGFPLGNVRHIVLAFRRKRIAHRSQGEPMGGRPVGTV